MSIRSNSKRGFTLVELLVVIGIIAVLVGILMPTLGRAKSSANAVKCMANLKTLGQAMTLYVGQNNGMLPVGYVDAGVVPQGHTGPYATTTDWTVLLLDVLNRRGGTYSDQDATGVGDAGMRAVFLCPESFRESTGKAFISNYSAHPRLLPNLAGSDFYSFVTGSVGVPKLQTYKLTRIRSPAERMVIFDASLQNNTWMAFACAFGLDRNALGRAPLYMTDAWSKSTTINGGQPVDLTPDNGPAEFINTDGDRYRGNIRFRHAKDTKANALMLDGHVETFTYNKSTRTSDLLRKHVYVTPPK